MREAASRLRRRTTGWSPNCIPGTWCANTSYMLVVPHSGNPLRAQSDCKLTIFTYNVDLNPSIRGTSVKSDSFRAKRSRELCHTRGCEPKMRMSSGRFSVFRRRVGRFRSGSLLKPKEPKRNQNTSRSASRSVSQRNEEKQQHLKYFSVHVFVSCGDWGFNYE